VKLPKATLPVWVTVFDVTSIKFDALNHEETRKELESMATGFSSKVKVVVKTDLTNFGNKYARGRENRLRL
jgi:hypothetical protein